MLSSNVSVLVFAVIRSAKDKGNGKKKKGTGAAAKRAKRDDDGKTSKKKKKKSKKSKKKDEEKEPFVCGYVRMYVCRCVAGGWVAG